jgi:hypothetical protein
MTPDAIIAAVREADRLNGKPEHWPAQAKVVAAQLLWKHIFQHWRDPGWQRAVVDIQHIGPGARAAAQERPPAVGGGCGWPVAAP